MRSTKDTWPSVMRFGRCSPVIILAVLFCLSLVETGWGQAGFSDNTPSVLQRPLCPDLPLQLESGAANPVFSAAVRWTCLGGSPSCENPVLVGQENVRDMLLGRQEFASECVWVKQCKILLRSGAAAQHQRFVELADPAPDIGQSGDLVVDPPTELLKAWSAAELAWSPAIQGVLALSANRLINSAGESIAGGVAIKGVATMPWLALADPSLLREADDRQVAHAIGHLFSLEHTTGDQDLMRNGGQGVRLSTAETQMARNHLDEKFSLLVPPPFGNGSVFLDRAFDGVSDAVAGLNHLDIVSCIVLDKAASQGKIEFLVGLAGLIPEKGPEGQTGPVYLALALNRDNDAQTGDNANLIVPDMDLPGTDFLIEVLLDRETGRAVPGLKIATGKGLFLDIELLPGLLQAEAAIGHLQFCSPTSAHQGPDAIPFVTEVRIEISKDVIAPEVTHREPHQSQRAFPRGMLFQVATALSPGQASIDQCPNGPTVLKFSGLDYPKLMHRRSVAQGDRLKVNVAEMPAAATLLVTVGAFEADLTPFVADDQGKAVFELFVPGDTSGGLTSLTVAVDDQTTALTAAGIIEITPCPADLNEDGELTIFDFLTFQNFWQLGLEPADYDGDGETTILDFIAYQNDFERGCPLTP